jgi:dihydropteroate synthase/2-amino-4-hydroxy-6-hydroxymethyldihydropteridine diphosphokinase
MAMVVLGLGSNLGDRLAHLRQALQLINGSHGLTVKQVSPLYTSAALLPDQAPRSWQLPYINLALTAHSSLAPLDLLAQLHSIETRLGRETGHQPWAPRTIDIDIIAWDQELISHPNLIIPHQHMLDRPFVLLPMADIVPNWRYPKPGVAAGQTATELAAYCLTHQALKISPLWQRIDTPQLMGIVNLTPDSFSADGVSLDQLLTKVQNLVADGSTIIDLGAEASNPQAKPLSAATEAERLLPALQALKPHLSTMVVPPKISIDTRHASVAELALSLGVDFINDVSGLEDPAMQHLVATNACRAIVMHNFGIPANSNKVIAAHLDVVNEVSKWGQQQLHKLLARGINSEQLIFDVGIGFGKTATQSLALLQNIASFHNLGLPLLVGHSRKSFLNQFIKVAPDERDLETSWLSAYLAQQQVAYLRVHNVAATSRVFRLGATFATAATV